MTKRILNVAAFGRSAVTFMACMCFGWAAVSQEDQYILPMRFAIIGDGVEQLPLEFEYDLEAQKVLKIGDTTFSSETFQITLGTLVDLAPQVAPYATDEERAESLLLFRWPLNLVDEGIVEAVGQSGRTLWRQKVSKADILDWSNRLAGYREAMAKKMRKPELDEVPFLKSVWASRGFTRLATDFLNSKERFRLCISRIVDEGQSRVCSSYMYFSKKTRKWTIEKGSEPERPARVIALQKAAALKARRTVIGAGTIQFLAELSNGLIYEFISKPPKLDLVELVKASDTTAKVVGFGQTPARDYQILNPANAAFLTRFLRWEETIGDFRQYWETVIPITEPIVYFPGAGGGLFKQAFKITRLPREAARPWLHRRTPDSTYVNGPWLEGVKAKNSKLTSTERRVVTSNEDDEFEWSFQALKRGELNRSNVVVKDGNQDFKAYFEMYKGYPRELSFRTSAVVGRVSFFNGEAAFNYWFEDIYGWTNYWLSRQRWGISAKYFRSMTPYSIGSADENIQAKLGGTTLSSALTMATFDLKYRLTPGLWNRDESWGLMFGYNQIDFSFFSAKALGFGFFWARSMPRLFDEILNQFPYFDRPKWVDMEVVYYPKAMNSGTTLTFVPNQATFGNWAINFHGKVLWTKALFGEAGFGLRSSSFLQETPQFIVGDEQTDVKRMSFNLLAFYATMGIGYQF